MDSTLRSALRPARVAVLMLAAAATLAPGTSHADFDLTFEVEKPINVGSVGLDWVKVHCVVTNTGTTPDTYNIYKNRDDTPPAWDVSICVGGEDGFCYAPFVGEVLNELPLNPGQRDTISCYFTPISGEGSGYATLTVESVGDNAVQRALTLGCITDGNNVLIVDGTVEGGDPIAPYYEDAISLLGMSSGTWRRYLAPIGLEDLQIFATTIWPTGVNSFSYDGYDRLALAQSMTGGGRVLISGQDIAYDLCDPGSPNSSPAARSWLRNWFGASYVSDDSGSLNLIGVGGDPVGQGMALAISGGDGANNQTDPDVVDPAAGGVVAWDYSGLDGASAAAIHVERITYRAVYLAFGFEAISSAQDRTAVMLNALAWLGEPVIGVADQGAGAVPRGLLLEQPRPNPFNPDLGIPFTIGREGRVSLRVVGSDGRVIRTLVDGLLPAGSHTRRWDGVGDGGRRVSSGVYFIELRAGDLLETRKVVLSR